MLTGESRAMIAGVLHRRGRSSSARKYFTRHRHRGLSAERRTSTLICMNAAWTTSPYSRRPTTHQKYEDAAPRRPQAHFPVPSERAGARHHGRHARRRLRGAARSVRLPQGCLRDRHARLSAPAQVSARGDRVLLPAPAPDHQQRQDQPEGRPRAAASAGRAARTASSCPTPRITISTRERARFPRQRHRHRRNEDLRRCRSSGIGGHSGEDKGDEQFEISDGRSVDEVYNAICEHGLQPVMADYLYV